MTGGGLGSVLGGARPCVDVGQLLGHVLERVHAEFVQLLESSRQSDDDARQVGEFGRLEPAAECCEDA